MKAVANFPESGKIQVIDVDAPRIVKPDDVLVKTLAIGLCGTDREIASQQYGRPPEDCQYLIIGHECLGEVIEVGEKVTRFKPGQLVVPRVRRPCDVPTCAPCRMGRPDFCLTGQFTERGIVGAHGFMCERFVDCEKYFHLVSEEAREFGVLTEPLTIAMKSLIQMQDVQNRLPYLDKDKLQSGDYEEMNAVVLGAGPVGLLGALTLINSGARVFMYSREEEPTASSTILEACSGQYVSSQRVAPEQFTEMTGPVDIMYEATGASKFAFEMAALLGRNGIYILTGVPGRKGPVSIGIDELMRDMVLKNQILIGTVNAGAPAFEAAVNSLSRINQRWPGVPEKLITEVIDPEDVANALSSPKSPGTIKQVVRFA